eukprot:177415_1
MASDEFAVLLSKGIRDKLNESASNGIFGDNHDNPQSDEPHTSHAIEWDINELFTELRDILKKTLDGASMNASSNIITKLITISDNKISSHLNKLERYLYSIQSLSNDTQCEWLLSLAIAFTNLFHQIQSNYSNHSHRRHSHSMDTHHPHHSHYHHHGHHHASYRDHYPHNRTNDNNTNHKGKPDTFDIEVSLCDSILVCCIEIFLIVLEQCANHKLWSQSLFLLEKILIMNGEINEPFQWLAQNKSYFNDKYKQLSLFGFKPRKNEHNQDDTMDIDRRDKTDAIPSFKDVKLKQSMDVNANVLNECCMKRISEISRLDNRNLYRYTQTQQFADNERIKLVNEWIFDVYNQSKGIQRLLSICLKRMDYILNTKDQKKMTTASGRQYILLYIENILQMLDILFCIISLNGNNKKVFDAQCVHVPVFVSYIATLFNKVLAFHQVINDWVIQLQGEGMEIQYLMNVSLNFEQIIDTICKLLHLPFLSQQVILRRYISIQCKLVFCRQIMYLFAKLSATHSNMVLNKQYLPLFAGDPALVDPLLTHLGLNSNLKFTKSLGPCQIAMNREILCCFMALNFYSMSKINVTIQDLLSLPSIQISTAKDKHDEELFAVHASITDKYSGIRLEYHLNVIEQEPLAMNKVKSQKELLMLFSDIGDDKPWTSPLLELFTLVGMKWANKRRKIKGTSLASHKSEIKKRLDRELIPIADHESDQENDSSRYEILSANQKAIRLKRSPAIKLPRMQLPKKPVNQSNAPRRSARLAQKRKSKLTTTKGSNKEENDEDKPRPQSIAEIFDAWTSGSLFESMTYLNIVSIYDSVINCIHCMIDYSTHHRKVSSDSQWYISSICNENADVFANRLVEMMIRTYSLNNESQVLYQDGYLHDMFASSQQLINTLSHIILYRDDSNNLISLILHKLLSIHAPPNCIDNRNKTDVKDTGASKQVVPNPRKRSRQQMSADDGAKNDDNHRSAKRFKKSHITTQSSTMNSSINVITSTAVCDMNGYWCKSLPLPICNWILRLMLQSPKISKDAIAKYCTKLFKGFWKFVYDTIRREIDDQINKKRSRTPQNKQKTPSRDNITVAVQHIHMFSRLVLSCDNTLREAFIHESMCNIHQMAVFVHESLAKTPDSTSTDNKTQSPHDRAFVFENTSITLLFRCILMMNQSVLSMIQQSKEREHKDKKKTHSKQIDIKYNSNTNGPNDGYPATVYPPPRGMGYNARIFNDPMQQNQSFYSLKYPNTSYPMDHVRQRLFLSPLTPQNMHKLWISIHDIFEENGCRFSEDLCCKPLNTETLKVIRSNSKTSARCYMDSVIYFAWLLSNELKCNFEYKCHRGAHKKDHQKLLFMDLTRLLCTLPITKHVDTHHHSNIADKMKEIRDTLTWKAIDPSNPMHLIVVSRVLSLSFYYSHKTLPIQSENVDLEEWKHDVPSDLLIWILETVKNICDYMKQEKDHKRMNHWWNHCIINMMIATISHQLIRDGSTIPQVPTMMQTQSKHQKTANNENAKIKSTGVDQMFNLSASRINDIIYPQLMSLCVYYITYYRDFIHDYCHQFEKEEHATESASKKVQTMALVQQLMNEYVKVSSDATSNAFPSDCFTKLDWNIQSLESFPITLDKIWRQHLLSPIKSSSQQIYSPPIRRVRQKPNPTHKYSAESEEEKSCSSRSQTVNATTNANIEIIEEEEELQSDEDSTASTVDANEEEEVLEVIEEFHPMDVVEEFVDLNPKTPHVHAEEATLMLNQSNSWNPNESALTAATADMDSAKGRLSMNDMNSLHSTQGYVRIVSKYSVLGVKSSLQALTTLLYQFVHRFPDLFIEGNEEQKASDTDKVCKENIIQIFLPALYNNTFTFLKPSFNNSFDALMNTFHVKDERIHKSNVQIQRLYHCLNTAKPLLSYDVDTLVHTTLKTCLDELEKVGKDPLIHYFDNHDSSGETVALKSLVLLLFKYLFCSLSHNTPNNVTHVVQFMNYLFDLFTHCDDKQSIEILHGCLSALNRDHVALCFDKLLNPTEAKRLVFDYSLNIVKYHIQFIHKHDSHDSSQSGFVLGAIQYYSNTFEWKQEFMNTHEVSSVRLALLDENLNLFLSLTLLNKTPHLFINTILNAFGDDLTKIIPSRIAQFINIDFLPLLRMAHQKANYNKPKGLSILADAAVQDMEEDDIVILNYKPKRDTGNNKKKEHTLRIKTSPTYSPTSPTYSQLNKITNYYQKQNQPMQHPINRSIFDEGRLHSNSYNNDYANGVLYCCTFANTGRNQYPKQPLYRCYSCDVNCVVCSLCAQICHYKHDLVYAGEISGYCDCGPNDMSRIVDKDNVDKSMDDVYQCDKCQCNFKPLSMDKIPKRITLDQDLLSNEGLNKTQTKLLIDALRHVFKRFTHSITLERRKWLHSILNCHDTYYKVPFDLVSLSSFRKSAFSVKSEFKSPIHWSQSIPMSILCVFQRPIFAVAEKKVLKVYSYRTLLNKSGSHNVELNKTSDLGKPYLKEDFSFNIHGIIRNELNENFVAIYGEKECQILELNLPKTDNNKNIFVTNTNNCKLHDRLKQNLTSYRKRHKLELSLDFLAQQFSTQINILKVIWIPDRNSSKLMVVTNMFIKIYDVGNIDGLYSPHLTLNLPPSSFAYSSMNCSRPEIADATYYYSPTTNQLMIFVLLNTTHVYYQSDCNDLCESVDLQNMFNVTTYHSDLQKIHDVYSAFTNEQALANYIRSTVDRFVKNQPENNGTDAFANDYKERYESYIREICKKPELGSIYFSNACNALFMSLPCPAIKYHISHSWSRKTFAISFEDICAVAIKDCQLLLRTKSNKNKTKQTKDDIVPDYEEEDDEDSLSDDDEEEDEEDDEDDEESHDEMMENNNEHFHASDHEDEHEDDDIAMADGNAQNNNKKPKKSPKKAKSIKHKDHHNEKEKQFEEVMNESPFFMSWMDLSTEQSCWPSIVVSSIHDTRKGTLVNPTGCFVIQKVNDRFYVSDIQTCLESRYDKCRPVGVSKIHLDGYNPRPTLSRLNYNMGFLTLFEDGSLHYIGFRSPNNSFKFSQYDWNDNTFGFLSDWFQSQPWQRLLPPSRVMRVDDGHMDEDITLFEQYTKLRPDEFDINGSISQTKFNDNGSELNQKYAYAYTPVNEDEKHVHHLNIMSRSRDKTVIAVRLQFVDEVHTPSKVIINGVSYPCAFSSVRTRWNDIRLPKRHHARNVRIDFAPMPGRETPVINMIEVYGLNPNARKRSLKRTQQLLLQQIPVLTRNVLYDYLKRLWTEINKCSSEELVLECTEYNKKERNDDPSDIDHMLDWLLIKSREQISKLNKQQYKNELLSILSELSHKPFIDKNALNPTITNHVFRSLTKLVNNIQISFGTEIDVHAVQTHKTVSNFINVLIKLCKHILINRNDAINLQPPLFNLNASIDMSSSYLTEIIFGLLFYFASIYPEQSMEMVMSFFTESLLSENHLVRLCFANHILRGIHMTSLTVNINTLITSNMSTNHTASSENTNALQSLLLPANPPPLEKTVHGSSLMRLPATKAKKGQIRIKQTSRRGGKCRKGLGSNSRSTVLPTFKPHLSTKSSKAATDNPSTADHDFFHKISDLQIGSRPSTSPPAILKDALLMRDNARNTFDNPDLDNDETILIIPASSQSSEHRHHEKERRRKRMIQLQQHILRKEREREQQRQRQQPPGPTTTKPKLKSSTAGFANRNPASNRPLSGSSQTVLAGGEALLQKWGITSFKRVSEIPCSNCNKIVKGGRRHICKHPTCNNFVLCPECHEDMTESERQQIHGGPWHPPHRPISLNVHQRDKSKRNRVNTLSTQHVPSYMGSGYRQPKLIKKKMSNIVIKKIKCNKNARSANNHSTRHNKGFRFRPLVEGSKAEKIAIETLLNCIVNDDICNAFKSHGGADMLPLMTVIVHLLCNQFAHDQILPRLVEEPVNDKEEMDVDEYEEHDQKEEKDEKEEKEEKDEKMPDAEDIPPKMHNLLSTTQITKLIQIIVSCLEYHMKILNDAEDLTSQPKSIEMFMVLLDALLVMISHQQMIQEKIGAYKKSVNNTTSTTKPSLMPMQSKAASKDTDSSSNNNSNHNNGHKRSPSHPNRVSWSFGSMDYNPNHRMLSQLMQIAENSEIDMNDRDSFLLRDYVDEDDPALDNLPEYASHGLIAATIEADEEQLEEEMDSAMRAVDVSAILDILPNETREPLEAAMAAASNHAERLEILRSNLPAMISSSPDHAHMFLGLKRKKKRPKLMERKKINSNNYHKNVSGFILEDDSDLDQNLPKSFSATHKLDSLNEVSAPSSFQRQLSASSITSVSCKKISFESKASALISFIIKELSKDFGDQLLALLAKVLQLIPVRSEEEKAILAQHAMNSNHNKLKINQNEILFFDFGGHGNDEWAEGCKLTQHSFDDWKNSIINIGTRFAHVLAEADSLQITAKCIPEWCQYLCHVISDRKMWSNSGFRKKSKTLLTIVCDNIVNKRHEIYDRYVYGKHLENIQTLYTAHQPIQVSIPPASMKPIKVKGRMVSPQQQHTRSKCKTVVDNAQPVPQKRGKKRKLSMDEDEDKQDLVNNPRKKRKVIHGTHAWLNKLIHSKRIDVPYASLCALHEELSGISNLNKKRQESWIKFLCENPQYLLLLWQMTLDIPNLSGDIINLLRKPAEYLINNKIMDKHKKDKKNESIRSLMMDLEAISCVLSSHLWTDFMHLYLCGSDGKQRESAKQCLIYIWYCLVFHASNDDKDKKKEAMVLCEEFVNKYCWWIPHVPSFGANGDWYLNMLCEILSDSDRIGLSSSIMTNAMNSLIECIWKQHSIAMSHPFNHLYGRLIKYMPNADELNKHYITSLACKICHASSEDDPHFKETVQDIRRMAKDGEVKHTHNAKIITFKQRVRVSSINIKIKKIAQHLSGSTTFGQRHIKTIHLYFYNKQCSNPTRLKHSQWMKAKTVHIAIPDPNASDNNNTDSNNTTGSNNNEIRMTLSMPIIAQCMMIEFSAFHENDDSESCICPRCAAPGNSTGYCQNCGENVFQCRKCRHINYENQKGFLCNACGYCRFVSFQITVSAKNSYNVDEIRNEEDQEKILSMIGSLSTNIDSSLCKTKEAAAKIWSKLNLIEDNPHCILHPENTSAIDEIRKIYMVDCKRLHSNLASDYQKLTSARNAVANYLYDDAAEKTAAQMDTTSSCYSCCIKFIEKVLRSVEKLCLIGVFRGCLVHSKESFFEQLLLHSIHSPDRILREFAHNIMCELVVSDFAAAQKIANEMKKELLKCVSHVSRRTSISEFSWPLKRYMKMLKCVTAKCDDVAWRNNMKFTFSILFFAAKHGARSSIVIYDIIMPCFELILSFAEIESDWLCNLCVDSFEQNVFEIVCDVDWLREWLLNSICREVRQHVSDFILLLCDSDSARIHAVLDALGKILNCADSLSKDCGGYCAEYFSLFSRILAVSLHDDCRLNILDDLVSLISAECEDMCPTPLVLCGLCDLFISFTRQDAICNYFRTNESLVAAILNATVRLQCLVLNKSKICDDCASQLSSFISDSCDIEELIIAHMDAFRRSDNRRLSRFILKNLCSVIKPEEESCACAMYLRKDRAQEEFIRGEMKHHPYSSRDIGGPLMRHIVEKIVLDSNMETPTDMFELLVANCIISHELRIVDVAEKFWRKKYERGEIDEEQIAAHHAAYDGTACPPMIICYRLRGLSGEATEDEINELCTATEDENDECFECLSVMPKCDGLRLLLNAFAAINCDCIECDVVERQLLSLLIKTMDYCCRIGSNRSSLVQLNSLAILLPITCQLLQYDDGDLVAAAQESIALLIAILSDGSHNKASHTQISHFLFALNSAHIASAESYLDCICELLPYLIGDDAVLARTVTEFFAQYLLPTSQFNSFYCECLIRMCGVLGRQENWSKFGVIRDIALNEGFVVSLLNHLQSNYSDLVATKKNKLRQQKLEAKSSLAVVLPAILRILRGLCGAHRASQNLAAELGVIGILHAMETLSTSNAVGPLAELLLEALCVGNEKIRAKLGKLRHKSAARKKKKQMKFRRKLLAQMNLKNSVVAVTTAAEDEPSEKIRCMICKEGYHLKPNDLLAIYVQNRDVQKNAISLVDLRRREEEEEEEEEEDDDDDVFSTATMSCFNLVHFSCHRLAVRADHCNPKKQKKEWEGAKLRNNGAECNNLLPIKCNNLCDFDYDSCVNKYWQRIATNFDTSHLTLPVAELITDDLRHCIGRYAFNESFNEMAVTGGKLSNIQLIPFLIQMARYELSKKTKQNCAIRKCYRDRLEWKEHKMAQILYYRDYHSSSQCSADCGVVESMEYVATQTLIFCRNLEQWNKMKHNLMIKLMKHAFLERDLVDTIQEFEYNHPNIEKYQKATTTTSTNSIRKCPCNNDDGAAVFVEEEENIDICCGHCRKESKKNCWKCNKCNFAICNACYCDRIMPLSWPVMQSTHAFKHTVFATIKPIFLLALCINKLHKIIKNDANLLSNADKILCDVEEELLAQFDHEWTQCSNFQQLKRILKKEELFNFEEEENDDDDDDMNVDLKDEHIKHCKWIQDACGLHI